MLRQLTLADMDAAALVHRAAFNHALPWLADLHTPAEDRCFFRQRVFPTCQVWGAVDDGALLGVIAFREDWVDQLYVLPRAQRQGLGTELLKVAQTSFGCLQLWTFQRNLHARRFYEGRGFVSSRRPRERVTRRTSLTPATFGCVPDRQQIPTGKTCARSCPRIYVGGT